MFRFSNAKSVCLFCALLSTMAGLALYRTVNQEYILQMTGRVNQKRSSVIIQTPKENFKGDNTYRGDVLQRRNTKLVFGLEKTRQPADIRNTGKYINKTKDSHNKLIKSVVMPKHQRQKAQNNLRPISSSGRYNDIESLNIGTKPHTNVKDTAYNLSQKHGQRIENLKKACQLRREFQSKTIKKSHAKFYNSEKFDFAYCKVPKVGSTYWTMLFAVLEYGLKSGKQLFYFPRMKVHRKYYNFTSSLPNITKADRRTILISRDPYSRLYSAFVDKMFVPLIPLRQANKFQRNTNKFWYKPAKTSCYNTTFQEFLDMIIATSKLGGTLNHHWAPISSLCEPCKVNQFLLIKQESFASDVAFAMKSVGVDNETYEFLLSSMKDQRAEFAIPGIIKTLYNDFKRNKPMSCFTWDDVSRRVWKAFQIQGYLDKNTGFPEDKFQNNGQLSSDSYVSDVILQTISEHKMSSEMSKVQRYEFLCDAYRQISAQTIAQIQNIYKKDFTLYGYSDKPPCFGELENDEAVRVRSILK